MTYTYDLNGNLKRIQSSNPGGTDLGYDWDQQNRLQTAKWDPDSSVWNSQASYAYDLSGNLGSITYPNGVATTYHFNDLNRLTDVLVQHGQSTLANFNYNPDQEGRTIGPAGERRAAREVINATPVVQHNVNYDYDDLYRLTKESILSGSSLAGDVVYDAQPGYGETDGKGFDRVGNRRSRSSTVQVVPSINVTHYDPNDRIADVQYAPTDPIQTVGYDPNGNTTFEFLPTPITAVQPIVPTIQIHARADSMRSHTSFIQLS